MEWTDEFARQRVLGMMLLYVGDVRNQMVFCSIIDHYFHRNNALLIAQLEAIGSTLVLQDVLTLSTWVDHEMTNGRAQLTAFYEDADDFEETLRSPRSSARVEENGSEEEGLVHARIFDCLSESGLGAVEEAAVE